jgi:GDP-L-fucose synthase
VKVSFLTESFWQGKKILITGGSGFLGSHLVTNLIERRGLSADQIVATSSSKDLRSLENCREIVRGIDIIINLAANVGGIGYNQKSPGPLFFDNLQMGLNMIEAARQAKTEKFVQAGTVCSYPKFAPIPFREDSLWDGYPEETNAPYGIAKKALLVMAQAYRQQYSMNIIYLLPVNLYGPGDNFDLESSHVIPALIRKFVDAVQSNRTNVTVWGTGKVSREFLYVEDAAEAIALATEKYNQPEPVNLGSGNEITISALTELIAKLVGFEGQILWDTSRPDGQPRRCLDTTRALREFGFKAATTLADGLQKTISWYNQKFVANAMA